jgi:glutaredoxin
MKATIYSLPTCPWCVKAKKLCDAFGIVYTEVNGKHPNWPTVPFILLDDKPIGGFAQLAAVCRKLQKK